MSKCVPSSIDQLISTMGSGNSATVERAHSVETEAHQDVFELRFDHLTFGGTTVLLLAAMVGLCWLCRRRNKRRQHKRQTQCHCQQAQTSQTASSMNQPAMPLQPMLMPQMPTVPWYPMMPTMPTMLTMPFLPPATNHWGPPPPAAKPSRFTEIQEPAAPPRPPPLRSRELPPPTQTKSPANAEAIV